MALTATADDALEEELRKVHWLPLESNPEVLTDFARAVGLPETSGFHDLYGLDPDLLAMVPQPCVAVVLLFPHEALSEFKAAQKERLAKESPRQSDKLFYMKQYVGNACGTIAVVHALANNAATLALEPGPLTEFLESCKGCTPAEAGVKLGRAEGLHMASESSAQGGQTETPELGADVDAHFICFVQSEGDVYELDGGKDAPINHGPTGGDFLGATARVVKQCFVEQAKGSLNFSMMALGPVEQ